jgi:hypothetical protein
MILLTAGDVAQNEIMNLVREGERMGSLKLERRVLNHGRMLIEGREGEEDGEEGENTDQ